jgi:predicted nucleic acid-binding protein
VNKYVIDASLIVRSLISPKSSAQVRAESLFVEKQKGRAEIFAPHLLLLETGNSLRFNLKNQKEAEIVFNDFLQLPIEYFVFNTNHAKEILKLSYALQASVYDTAYHFLAKIISGVFVTCDEKYYRQAKKIGDIEFVE